MKRYVKFIIGLVLFVGVIVGASGVYSKLLKKYEPNNQLIANEDQTQVPFVDEKSSDTEVETTTDFTVYDQSGEAVTLSSKFGKPIVLNFWASWCSPCKSEMPVFQKVYEEYGEEVEFVMVNLTDGFRETLEKANEYVNENDYTFPVYYDTDEDAAYAYQIMSIPTTYFIDADGTVATYTKGVIKEDTLRHQIEYMLDTKE